MGPVREQDKRDEHGAGQWFLSPVTVLTALAFTAGDSRHCLLRGCSKHS